EYGLERIAPGTVQPPGEPRLINTSYFARDAGDTILVYRPERSTVEVEHAQPLGRALREHFDIDSAVAVALQSETLTAHLLIPGARNVTGDDLALAHIAGRLALATLEQFFFVQQVRQTASAEERLRISRELHDGIVQSLGGVGLQLQAIRADLPRPAAERIGHVQRVIEHDQRELRALVRELRPHDPRSGGALLRDELQRMSERFALEWGLTVLVDVPGNIEVPTLLAHELCRIANESLSNAARHGGATRADVSIAATSDAVTLRIADNGRGFPFTGRYGLAELDRDGRGPRTLKERVVTLGGSLTIDSTRAGAAVEARVPLPEAG
ncbi:MAG TPA: sensor histidine kinase, partial [Thermoanaerobaculia bacterium]|nr:sensor histidine kinase [Thermoanaerobaculia bacterium]